MSSARFKASAVVSVVALTRRRRFFTREPEAREGAADGRGADADLGALLEVVASGHDDLVGAARDFRAQQLELLS